MVARPVWSGHLKLSLVTCPVALYTATVRAKKGVSFNFINPQSNDRIRMTPTDPSSGEAVERSELIKGYEVDKGQYVTVTDEELRELRVPSNGAVQIERFVPEADIDRLYWDSPYFLVPDGEVAYQPYSVIREAMREEGQVALARVVMNGRERQLALEVRGKGIVAHAIRSHQEVRSAADHFDRLPEAAPDGAMVAIAKQILQQHAGPFDPSAFLDRYQQAVLELVERKKAEQGLIRAGRQAGRLEPDEGQIVDLMAALKASLAGAPKSQPRKAPGRRTTKPRPAPRATTSQRAKAG